jgi:perosamine synthetase
MGIQRSATASGSGAEHPAVAGLASDQKRAARSYSIPWAAPDVGARERAAIEQVLDSGWLGMGPKTKEFERGLCAYTGARTATVVNNGTSALLTAYLANGIQPGDVVLAPTFTFVATVSALLAIGARPVLVDCDPLTLNVDPDEVERVAKAHPEAKALVFVDVDGQPCDIDRLREIARDRSLALIQDAAESFGATYRGRPIGGYDHTTIFSFHIAKQLTTVEGGAVVTDDAEIAERCRLIRSHGEGPKKYVHIAHGLNFRPTDLQSAIGLVQLERVDEFLAHRERLAKRYRQELADVLGFQLVPPFVTRATWMIFVAFCHDAAQRNAYNAWLNGHGIDTRIPWPPVHQQPFFQTRYGTQSFPHAERAFARVLSLPMGNAITDEQVAAVLECTREFFASS